MQSGNIPKFTLNIGKPVDNDFCPQDHSPSTVTSWCCPILLCNYRHSSGATGGEQTRKFRRKLGQLVPSSTWRRGSDVLVEETLHWVGFIWRRRITDELWEEGQWCKLRACYLCASWLKWLKLTEHLSEVRVLPLLSRAFPHQRLSEIEISSGVWNLVLAGCRPPTGNAENRRSRRADSLLSMTAK